MSTRWYGLSVPEMDKRRSRVERPDYMPPCARFVGTGVDILAGDDNERPITALDYSRGMQEALREEEFRWLDLAGSELESNAKRGERSMLYRRFKNLFKLEVALTRKQKRAAMAIGNDWSGLQQYLRESFTIARYQAMLNLAGWLFAAGIPGAPDICDAAVFGIVRTVYLPAA